MLKIATKFLPDLASFERAHAAGFRACELWTDQEVLLRTPEILRIAKNYPFHYAFHFPNRNDLSEEALEQCCQLYLDLPARCIVIHKPQFDRYSEWLTRRIPAIRLAVENHRLNPSEFDGWADRYEHLNLDVEHFWRMTLLDCPIGEMFRGLDRFLDLYGHKLRHVHLPGYVPGYEEHRPMYTARDFVFGTLDRLARCDFEGLIVSEVDHQFQTWNDLRMDVLLCDTWRKIRLGLSETAVS